MIIIFHYLKYHLNPSLNYHWNSMSPFSNLLHCIANVLFFNFSNNYLNLIRKRTYNSEIQCRIYLNCYCCSQLTNLFLLLLFLSFTISFFYYFFSSFTIFVFFHWETFSHSIISYIRCCIITFYKFITIPFQSCKDLNFILLILVQTFYYIFNSSMKYQCKEYFAICSIRFLSIKNLYLNSKICLIPIQKFVLFQFKNLSHSNSKIYPIPIQKFIPFQFENLSHSNSKICLISI